MSESNKQYYLYTVKDQKAENNFSVVGVIDGSGSMEEYWADLSEAWNNFIEYFKSPFCIQFDHRAKLQDDPKLDQQKGGATNISEGFYELIRLVKSNRLKKNVMVIFITDGVGTDKLEDYIDNVAAQFSQFHEQEYQFKFFTLAVGYSFSHVIIAELKSKIHNSTLISSQMELIQNSKVDFKKKLSEIQEELFYKLIKVEPSVSLVPLGKQLNVIAPNQTIITEHQKIKINGKEVDLSQLPLSNSDLFQFVNQIFLKLMEDSTRGQESVKDEAQKQLLIINELIERVPQEDRGDYLSDIQDTLTKITDLASGKQQLNLLSASQAAKSIAILQKSILAKSIQKQQVQQEVNLNQEFIERAKKRLGSMRKSVKIKTVFPQIEKVFRETNLDPQLSVKYLQEKKGGANLQRYAMEYQAECTQLFELLHTCYK